MFTMGIAALALAPAAFAQNTTTLGVTVAAEATFTTLDSSTTLTHAGSTFADFTGTTNFNYKLRTTASGTGSITVAVTAFSGTGAPQLTDLSYTCGTASGGTGCSSSTGASTTATSVVSFGADSHSDGTGGGGSMLWTLKDDANVKAAAYTTTATFTISAT